MFAYIGQLLLGMINEKNMYEAIRFYKHSRRKHHCKFMFTLCNIGIFILFINDIYDDVHI